MNRNTNASDQSPFGSAGDRAKGFASVVQRDGAKAIAALRAGFSRIGAEVERRGSDARERPGVRTAAIVVLSVAIVGMVGVGIGRVISHRTTAAPTAQETTAKPVFPASYSDGRDGRAYVFAGGKPMFPLPSGSLSSFADTPVEMLGATVGEVQPKIGYWIGIDGDKANQVFVEMRQPANDKQSVLLLPELHVGQKVNVSGYVREMTSDAEMLGISDPARREQLDRHLYVVAANGIRPQ